MTLTSLLHLFPAEFRADEEEQEATRPFVLWIVLGQCESRKSGREQEQQLVELRQVDRHPSLAQQKACQKGALVACPPQSDVIQAKCYAADFRL
mmetsp:Transcript_34147/g.55112  ORF Transcript_34147/g.55112 Transcript_34147/m.55112 type:complete len:94 (-) Transcript_34147:5-286(-)